MKDADVNSPLSVRRLRTADEYIASLRDGRRVYYRGERVADVTTHPVLNVAVQHAALDYRMVEDPRYRDLAVDEAGYSRYFKIPTGSGAVRTRPSGSVPRPRLASAPSSDNQPTGTGCTPHGASARPSSSPTTALRAGESTTIACHTRSRRMSVYP